MNIVDSSILIVIGFSILIGIMRGGVKELLSVIAWVLAITVSILFAPLAAQWLSRYLDIISLRLPAAYFGLFVGTLITASIIGFIISLFIKLTGLGLFDRLLGLFFGFTRGIIIILSLIIFMPSFISIDEEIWWKESKGIAYLKPLEAGYFRMLSPIGQLLGSKKPQDTSNFEVSTDPVIEIIEQ